MFEAYLALLDTIRQKRFSLLVNNIRKEIIKTLRSDKFSARMRQYLEGMHEEGEPFTDFSLEPGHITQIKKIINALYHAEIALQDLESVNLRDGDRKVADLAKLYNHTIHHIYQASYLITHLDVDLSEIFTKELAALAPLLENFHAYAHNYTEETRTFLGALNYRDISHKTGVISGIVVDQLQRQDGEVDYEFLTQFTATLPGYLDQFTAYIRRFSEQVTHEPVFDKKKIEELQNHGLLLLNSLESLQGSNSFFLSLRALHYIHIIRHTITLTMSIIDQAGHMTETSQDTIRDNLAKLKYELLPELFGFVDKLEAQAMLEPGVLSKPLMARVKPMYQWLMYYVQKLVDFSQKGEELLIIEDPKFIAARTEQTYQRLAEDEEKLFLLAEAQHAANEFFKILKNPGYQRKRLVDLPDEIKNQLIFYYRMMQPYMARVDVVKDNVIIAGLTQTRDFFTTFSSWLGQYSDGIPEIVALEDNLKDVFVKEQRSRRFQRQLNLDIIDSVHQSSDASSLFPYSSKEPPLAIDEAVALGVDESSVLAFAKTGSHNLLANPQELTFAQAIKLYKFYEIKSIQSVHALKAYQDFVELLNTQNNATLFVRFDEPLKKQLISLYRVFQPYLVHVTAGDKATAEYDRKIVQALTGNLSSRTGIRVSDVHRLNTAIHTCLVETNERLEAKKQAFGHKASALYQEENRAKPLVHAKGAERAHYVIRQTEYLRILADFRSSLMQLTQVFNHSIREKLEPASEGIPFPELEDVHKALSQSSQVLMLKRLFNALYYLEQIGASLNELNDKSTEINYVRYILKASSYVYEIINLGNALRSEPYLAFIAQDILQNVQKGYAKFMQLARPYLMEATEEQPDEKPQVNAVMLYSLNAMMILPEHIAALRGEKEFPPERMQAIHKHAEKVATNIQRIIAHSNSYVRLLFEIPTMYGLFRELKSKLSLMASSSHDAVLDHLEDMRNVLFPRILLEADEWEDKLGLNPGTLSSAMKAILDEFYCGLLEPLDLHSRRHLALVTSAVPLDKRLEATRQRINQAEIEQVRLREKLEKLEKLAGSISLYKAHKAKPTTTLATVQHLERSMREQFVAALPLLRQETAYLDINSLPEETGSMSVDRALNQVHGSDLKNIESLAKASISHLRGLHASHQLTIETAREKSAYLHEQKIMQQDFNAKFVLDYTTSAFRKHAKAFSSRPFGLVHSSREYKRNLFNYLQVMEKEIVEASLEAEDINKQISDLLGEKIKHFEEENYQKYYHLETIMLAIEAFKLYLHNANIELQNNNSIFENRETLIIKSQLIEKLENIARNEQLPIDDRVEQLKKETSKPTFKTQMLKYHQYDQICFAWLKQCVLSFLELIHLYTPTYKKQYNKLVKAAEEVPETGYLSARFGLFSAPRRNYDLPSEVVAIDPVALPTAAPV
ncbi:hypothetical protein [Legionella oakridgensis]|uniref:hypothetical protein n=1 Tax=Legionella oakridgensis TaxID=29423 RepID=UPI0003DE005B|nr:hypothetical protein [Legionella oakridgensis]ETO93873.1 hypothetical protein LOR_37c04060 [Legionella oakridgensis RV-2-2007]